MSIPMRPFQFRLATLLRLRESIRDERRARLAEAYRAAAILEQRQAELQSERESLRRMHLAAGAPGSVQVESLLEVQRYELVVDNEQRRLAGQRAELEPEIEARRLALQEADKQVRILEKLRERQHVRHRAGEAREEVKRLDEIALRRAPTGAGGDV